ncbi:hypothetical protein OIU79_008266 [Salix purpurea]|uniref:Uncharacterized protein n=1 Tax=Salix purpurea TaxID=77065 RepID=A0A9Q0TI69_SALPP|nr:hypothetical protein OIU79_008266 [Salix purpurea]
MISQRQGSRSSDTGQNPARVTLSAVADTDPNSKTVTFFGGLSGYLNGAVHTMDFGGRGGFGFHGARSGF